MKVIIQQDTVVKFFDNVTDIKCFFSFDRAENKIEVYQGKKKMVFEQYKINGMEIKEDA